MKIVDDAGAELPWDGATFGNLLVRGHWVCERYYGAEATRAAMPMAGSRPAMSPPSTRTARWRSPTAPRT